VYFCDNGILKILAGLNFGQIFENAIYNQLKQKGEIDYFRTKLGAEVDFVIKNVAYEVKSTATASDIKNVSRSIRPTKIKDFFVVSKNYVDESKNVVFGEFL